MRLRNGMITGMVLASAVVAASAALVVRADAATYAYVAKGKVASPPAEGDAAPPVATASRLRVRHLMGVGGVNQPFSFQIVPTGGTAPYRYAYGEGKWGALDPSIAGLTFDTDRGVFSGSPRVPSLAEPLVIVTDATGQAIEVALVFNFTGHSLTKPGSGGTFLTIAGDFVVEATGDSAF